ncbi:MAG: 50S ribosomal protein L9 [Porticoccaceae bacterium]|jgi:large subunit ribosomal protein L9|nr:50S ribosomal protein L9 [Porticoccaceae bacterium]
MDVILLEKVGRIGDIGDQVDVKSGFGRNYLIPQGKAVRATPENIEKFEARRAELEKAAADKLTSAQGRAKLIEEIGSITITQLASDEGRLFGSVGTREIAEAMTAAGEELEKSEVLLPEGALRDIGEYDVDLQLHSDVTVTIQLIVAPE